MIPYGTMQEAEAVLGRTMTWAEAAWFRYSAVMPDTWLLCHNLPMPAIIFLVVPLPLLLAEQLAPAVALRYKLQPQVRPSSPTATIGIMMGDSPCSMLLVYVPFQLMYLLTFKIAGIRTGIPLPSAGEIVAKQVVYALVEDYISYWIHRFLHTEWGGFGYCSGMAMNAGIRTGISLPSAGEIVAKLVVYALVEDYISYWIHRFLHTEWGYNNFHHVHHKFTAPTVFAAAYGHWAEVAIGGMATIAGPVIVPCHVTTHWLWFAIRAIETIEAHTGYNFPFNPTKFIPFFGGAEFHDYHHRAGGRRSNYAPIFTYCDYIYGTDKGYRYHKASLAERKKLAGEDNLEKRGGDQEKQE